jgi:hypothetical protein
VKRTIISIVVLLALLAGCQATPTATPEPTSQPTPVAQATSLPPDVPTLAPTSAPTDAPTSAPEQPTNTLEPTTAPTEIPTIAPSATPAPQASGWTPDGVVAEGEYAHSASFGSVRLDWSNDGEFLYMALEARTKGWVAVGFKPGRRMEGADYILGFVKDGQVQIHDAYGDAPTGSHPADKELGGSDDIVAFGGAESDSGTVIEFQIPLNSGDQYDNVLEAGATVQLLWAVGAGDNYTSPHASRGTGSIALD